MMSAVHAGMGCELARQCSRGVQLSHSPRSMPGLGKVIYSPLCAKEEGATTVRLKRLKAESNERLHTKQHALLCSFFLGVVSL